ncbi:tryptophan synthase subunit alpha [Spiractinospora alimapuensis]|uniref:tryptophan synthase subunit alpha n=1 Tax=Spiractinospora alimapuensis TaxID=2820884 RepID=UPI001EEACE49|nr:tryptophan synthase subunit alpha [Spiractinospora alimapuensis]QVQ53089.1 tryptophan synthase subunit alpha [Spiractinospora alimapuensis]
MTTRLQQTLARTRAQNRAALVGYMPAGFPDAETSPRIVRAMVEGGCDVVEVGLPYSDPTMDGPTIQRAAEIALAAGTVPSGVFPVVEAVTEAGAAGLVMSYYNPIDRYGVDRFARDLAGAGGSGIITPDLLPEEAGDWHRASDAHGLDRIYLVAPSSTDTRLKITTDACRGFVYAASLMGVTGTRASVSGAAESLVARTRAVTGADGLPICVGLGISTGAQAAQVAAYADGVIVGAGFCQRVLDAATIEEAEDAVRRFAEELAAGVRSRS